MSSKDENDASIKLLLEEYVNIKELFLESEQIGERRVNFFITLITSVAGGFGIAKEIFPNMSGTGAGLIVMVTLLALFFFGLITFARILTRNVTSDGYKYKMNKIRRFFKKTDPSIVNYLPWNLSQSEESIIGERISRWEKWYYVGSGGLLQTVALLNNMVIAIIFSIGTVTLYDNVTYLLDLWPNLKDLFPYMPYILAALLGILSLLAWYLQHRYALLYYTKKLNEKREVTNKESQEKLEKNQSFTGKYLRDTEEETSLIIFSSSPKCNFLEIENISSVIDGYIFDDQGSLLINDIYYDMDNMLHAKKIVLRLRVQDGKRLITLKGPSKNRKNEAPLRMEIERSWSYESLNLIVTKLRELVPTIHLKLDKNNISDNDPWKVLKVIGFEPIQNRETKRKIINLYKLNDKRNFGQLALDHVTYSLNEKSAKYFNLEVEANKDNKKKYPGEIMSFTDKLIIEYFPILKYWPYSKFVTGKVIERLIANQELDGCLDEDLNLKALAFVKIEDVLNNNGT